MSTASRVLHVAVCAAPPATEVGALVGLAQADGWDVCIIATPNAPILRVFARSGDMLGRSWQYRGTRPTAATPAGCATARRSKTSDCQLDGAQDYRHRLETDADDVAHLIQHLRDGSAVVFGTSSGAIGALEALVRHPFLVRTLLPHEPPAMRLLADGQRWIEFFQDVYKLFREAGVGPR